MATHALSSSHALALSPSRALSTHVVDADDAPTARTSALSLQPSLMRRMFDAFTTSQMRRAQREVDRILGPGSFHRTLPSQRPPAR